MSNDSQSNWKLQVYGIGLLGGVLFGLASAYLYSRAAEEDAEHQGGKPARMSTAQLIGLLLTSLGLIRQIAESGKVKK
ncbi:MAG: hypothetical protein K8L99_13305 [Anaerolineae bacterium]|nr:hypothetical protein [Anaerolineae bacterium]